MPPMYLCNKNVFTTKITNCILAVTYFYVFVLIGPNGQAIAENKKKQKLDHTVPTRHRNMYNLTSNLLSRMFAHVRLCYHSHEHKGKTFL